MVTISTLHNMLMLYLQTMKFGSYNIIKNLLITYSSSYCHLATLKINLFYENVLILCNLRLCL